jgi:hypothetical protein
MTLLFIVMITILQISCSDKKTECGPDEYINWINNPENHMISEYRSDSFTFSLQYRPAPYLALIEAGTSGISKEELNEIEKGFSHHTQFLFQVSLSDGQRDWLQAGAKKFNDIEEQIKYLSFSMQKDFQLVTEKDTIDCSMFHFERDYGIRPNGTFLLGFPFTVNSTDSNDIVNISKSLKVIYNDSAFEDETVEFNFSSKDLNKIPTLKL